MSRGQRGYTLIELILAITILAVVAAPLSGAVVLGLRTGTDAEARLLEANDGRLLATFLGPDVQSATTVSTTDTTCGGAGTRLAISWREGSTDVRVAYVAESPGTEQHRLVRRRCVGSAVEEQVIAALLAPTTGSVSVSCPSGQRTVTAAITQRSGAATTVSATTRTTTAVCP